MKSLLSILIVLTIVSPLCAGQVLVYEDFESGTVTNPIVDGVSGWTGDAYIMYSDRLVDSGQSAEEGALAWPYNHMAFTNTPVAGEVYTLSATVLAPGVTYPAPDASYVVLGVDKADGSGRGLNACDIDVGAGALLFAFPGGSFTVTPQPTVATDVKMEISDTAVDCYYRTHGVANWTLAGSGAGIPLATLAGYDEVTMLLHRFDNPSISGIDTISLESSVPEPSTLALLATGMIGLICAWRKRK